MAKKTVDITVHIRVRADSVQKLRVAIATTGGVFHGCLQREASMALEERAAILMKRMKAEAKI